MLTIRLLHLISMLAGSFDWMQKGTEPTGIWKVLNDVVEDIGYQCYRLFSTIGIVFAILAVLVAFIMIMGWQRMREAGKEKIAVGIFALLLILSVPFVVKTINQFSNELNDSVDGDGTTEAQTIWVEPDILFADIGDDYVVNVS